MGSIQRTFRAHVPLYACTSLSCVATAAILSLYGITPKFGAAWLFLIVFLLTVSMIVAAMVAREIFCLVADGFPADPLKRIARRLYRSLCAQERLGNIFHSTLGLAPILLIYAAFKGSITLIHPFGWDLTFYELDNYIGFGHTPYELLQPLLGHPALTTFLSYTYYAWFFVLYGCLAWQAFSKHASKLRMQFLISLALAFFLAGCVLATVFSSAGPCYFFHLNFGFDPYETQLAYLRSIGPNSLLSVIVQANLWDAFSSGEFEHGVSAMPSMHVTIAVIIALFGWRKGGLAAFVLPVFAVLITLGSIHLAWHYASDAIADIALAVLFWFAAGRLVESTSNAWLFPAEAPAPLGQPALSRTEL